MSGNMEPEFKLRKYKPAEQIPEYATVLFAGGRRTGKSFCGRDFLWHIKDKVYDCNVFSGTIDPDHRWEQYTPKTLVKYCLEEFDEPSMLKAIRLQEKRKRIAEKYSAECPPTCMVFEDIGHLTPSIWKSKPLMAMIYNGRWARSYCFLMLQYLIDLRKGFRGSIDVAVFTREANAEIREIIRKNFAGCLSPAQFASVFAECTANKKVMVVNCRSDTGKIEDTIFWYKAKDRGYFKVGHPDVWKARTAADEKEESDPEDDSARERAQSTMIGKSAHRGPGAVVHLLGDKGDWNSDGEWDVNLKAKKQKKKKSNSSKRKKE